MEIQNERILLLQYLLCSARSSGHESVIATYAPTPSEFVEIWQETDNKETRPAHRTLQRVTLLRILQAVLYPTLVQDKDFMTSITRTIARGTTDETKEALLALIFQFQGQFYTFVEIVSFFLEKQNMSLSRRLFCLREVLAHCSESTNVSRLLSFPYWRNTLQQVLLNNSMRLSALPIVGMLCFMNERIARSSLPFWTQFLFYGTESLRVVAYCYISDILFLWPSLLLLPTETYGYISKNQESSSIGLWRLMVTFARRSVNACLQLRVVAVYATCRLLLYSCSEMHNFAERVLIVLLEELQFDIETRDATLCSYLLKSFFQRLFSETQYQTLIANTIVLLCIEAFASFSSHIVTTADKAAQDGELVINSLLTAKPKLLWPMHYLMEHLQPYVRPLVLSSLRANLQNLLHFVVSETALLRLLTPS